jgi:hypothetical protein
VKSFKAGVRIPVEFRGELSSEPKTCGIEGDDYDTRLFVEAVTVHYYDVTHVVTSVKVLAPGSIALSYGPLIDGYHDFIPPPVLTVSKDGRRLEAREATGKKELLGRWTRCLPGRR